MAQHRSTVWDQLFVAVGAFGMSDVIMATWGYVPSVRDGLLIAGIAFAAHMVFVIIRAVRTLSKD